MSPQNSSRELDTDGTDLIPRVLCSVVFIRTKVTVYNDCLPQTCHRMCSRLAESVHNGSGGGVVGRLYVIIQSWETTRS